MGNWKFVVFLVLAIGLVGAGVHWWNIRRHNQALEARQTAVQDFQTDFGQMLMAASADNQDDFMNSNTKSMVDLGRIRRASDMVHTSIGGADDPALLLSSDCFQQASHYNYSVHLAHALHPDMQLPARLPDGLFECMERK